jgi:hypothetical protein
MPEDLLDKSRVRIPAFESRAKVDHMLSGSNDESHT